MKVISKGDYRLSWLTHSREVRLPLWSLASRLGLVLLVAIPAAMLAFQGARIALAAHFARRLSVAGLRRAIELDPDNAAYPCQLGLVYAYSFNQANLSEAVYYLRKATELNPHKALYWSDLAEICDSMGDSACSNQAVQRALTLSSTTPRLEWRAGNHSLQTGRDDEAFRHFRRLLELDGAYAQPVFQICLRVEKDPHMILQKVIPPGRQLPLKLVFLDLVSARGDIDFANQLWSRISSGRLVCKFAEVEPYLSNLLAAGDLQQAAAVWSGLEKARVIPQPSGAAAGNLVYDGRFEHVPLDAGFDWRASNTPYVEADFQDPSAYRGSHCLRVDYAAGRNVESMPVYQLVRVVPGRAYRLQAEVRSQGITSTSGPRLRVTDVNCPACLNASTPSTVGTTPWQRVTLDFAASAKTRLVRLSVWRPRSWSFPMEISGSFWLDDVSITALPSVNRVAASTN